LVRCDFGHRRVQLSVGNGSCISAYALLNSGFATIQHLDAEDSQGNQR
jgi:hypothetical protein